MRLGMCLRVRHAAIIGVLVAVHVAGQCGPGGEKPYPPGSTACPSQADGMPTHINNEAPPAPAPLPAPQQASANSNVCAVGPCPPPLLGSVAYTTQSGQDARSGISFSPGEDMFGPFEAGFNSMQDNTLSGLGCSPASKGYLPGGIDTQTANDMLAHACGIQLPRTEGNRYIGLLDECGGHTKEYHFHQHVSCLYAQAGGHSDHVGKGLDNQGIFGIWEDFATKKKPLLDACGGHFGTTPTSGGKVVYHYHVQEKAPFFIGCYGPAKDAATGNSKLVTIAECRALFPTDCGDGDEITITTAAGSFKYDLWCPCFDDAGSNMGGGERAVFSTAGEQLDCDGSCASDFTPVSATGGAAVPSQVQSWVPVVVGVVGVASAMALFCACCQCRSSGSKKRFAEVPDFDEEQERSESS
eukprot:TRINITY_DN90464_c0_g1_i1.p1 TRINITY_DN90464_c0_g1~~TRINITY_DN90464_c0_g1_i1.p1  ORF type:complete len:412 (+),score=27.78 TRINITY_DN90464_c0_g1_i1:45-1280(+)